MTNWKTQIEGLNIPYPQKDLLAKEVEEHLEHFPEEHSQAFEKEDLNNLYETHNNLFFKTLNRLRPRIRNSLEHTLSVVPVLAFFIYLKGENYMLDFIKQGGLGMYIILAVSAALFAKELLLIFRLLVLRDHSKTNLKVDTTSVALGVAALILLGVTGTALGTYYSASYVEHNNLSPSIFVIGLKESMTCLIVSASAATSIILLHFLTRRTLAVWKVPGL